MQCIHMCHLEFARLEVSIGVCLFTARQCLDNNLIRIGMFVCRLINCPPSFSPLTSPICPRDVILGNFRDIMRYDCSLIGSYWSHVMNINEERRDQSRR